MEFVIITGLSGAGKTGALHAMEDIGFYCVDNLPTDLLLTFYNLCVTSTDKAMKRVAVVIDARGGDNLLKLLDALVNLKNNKKEYKLLFLDCGFNQLVARFKETRRRHPLTDMVQDNSMEGALNLEIKYIEPFRRMADYVIDTTNTTSKQLKERISSIFLCDVSDSIILTFMSFGFKYGMPLDCDTVFDVRCLPNPFYVPELRPKTGLDKDVYDYVFDSEEIQQFVGNLVNYLDFSVPLYLKEGKVELVVGIGCTGGQHRSVAIARLLSEHFSELGYNTVLTHRDMTK